MRVKKNKSLFQLKWFWLGNGAIVLIATILMIIIQLNDSYNSCWTADCFIFFWEKFKVPLSILALIIPYSALITSDHRSRQSKKQIDLASSNSLFANHFKHREEFAKYIEAAPGYLKPYMPEDVVLLYNKLFPDSRNGDFSPNTKKLNLIEIQVKEMLQLFKNPDQTKKEFIEEAITIMYIVNEITTMKTLPIHQISISTEFYGSVGIPNTFDAFLTDILWFFQAVKRVIAFEGTDKKNTAKLDILISLMTSPTPREQNSLNGGYIHKRLPSSMNKLSSQIDALTLRAEPNQKNQ